MVASRAERMVATWASQMVRMMAGPKAVVWVEKTAETTAATMAGL
jgi:hypothetical protein